MENEKGERSMEKENSLLTVEDFLENKSEINIKGKNFENLMFVYKMAIKQIENNIEIINEEFKFLYNYELIDHISTRIKSPESIIKKMKKK